MKDEKSFVVLTPWEEEMPTSCKHCDGNRYVSAVCYAYAQERAARERLAKENEELRRKIAKTEDLLTWMSRVVASISDRNREALLVGIEQFRRR
jgi:hypothetical protein